MYRRTPGQVSKKVGWKSLGGPTFGDLAIETSVDFQAKKMLGEVMFTLVKFSMPGSDKLILMIF